LMPSLQKAKNSAKLLTCSANIKQMGVMTAAYQADNNGSVAFLLTKFTSGMSWNVPAKYTYLSLALSDYAGASNGLSDKLDTRRPWPLDKGLYRQYSESFLPKFFVCPFVRSKQYEKQTLGTVTIGSTTFGAYNYKGYGESYGPWLWAVKRGPGAHVISQTDNILDVPNHPYGDDHGYPKHGVLNWHNMYSNPNFNGHPALNWQEYYDKKTRWDSASARRVGASSLANATGLMCEMGEYTSGGAASGTWYITNYKSHFRKGRGGTNVLFGDMHVGWVQGSDIGWK